MSPYTNTLHTLAYLLGISRLLLAMVEQRDPTTTSMVHGQYLSSPTEQAVPLTLTQWPKQSVI